MARWRYDEGLRPTHQYVEASGSEALVMRTVYGESLANAEVLNLRGQAYRVYDGAGVQTAVAYDFKGGLLAAERQLAVDVTATLDWSALGELEDVTDLESAAVTMLETEVFQTSSTFDALGRARTQTTPDGTVVRLAYNEAALLESVSANVRGSASETAFVSNVDYDAQGRRSLIAYGNGTETSYAYDDVTQRLTRMRTSDSTRTFQDLTYTYDVVGNIVEIGDGAQDNVYFGGTVVTARQRYEYDALYRLTDAEGREHIGQNAAQPSEFGANASAHPQDGTAMRGYAEAYVYDVVGNILEMQHAAAGGNWTRRYQYAANGNRLQATSLPGDAAGQHSATYGYDAHGNMSSMPHLSAVSWNYADQMRSADLGGGGTVYFVYDGAGQRVRKVSVNLAGTQTTERIYLGAYELYRERTNGAVQLERETLHIADDSGRMCDVETRTVESGSAVGTPTTHHRYQYSNHLGSAALELTGSAEVISYEEYHPYGTSSYRAVNSSIDVSERTYRYTGKERDEETGLGYHGARYYACWLGRWTASDPIGLGDGVNRYGYVSGRPIVLHDLTGRNAQRPGIRFGPRSRRQGGGVGFEVDRVVTPRYEGPPPIGGARGGRPMGGYGSIYLSEATDRTPPVVRDAMEALVSARTGHAFLDVVGLSPGPGGILADLMNAAWYSAEGDYSNAAISLVSAAYGDVAKATRADGLVQVMSNGGGRVAPRVGRSQIGAATETGEAQARASREAAEHNARAVEGSTAKLDAWEAESKVTGETAELRQRLSSENESTRLGAVAEVNALERRVADGEVPNVRGREAGADFQREEVKARTKNFTSTKNAQNFFNSRIKKANDQLKGGGERGVVTVDLLGHSTITGRPITPGVAQDLVGNALKKGARGTNVTEVVVRASDGSVLYRGLGR